jgi:hypothetical protein
LEPQGFVMTENPENEMSVALRGNHSFYLYLDGNIKANLDIDNLNWLEGKDEIKISLTNSTGEILCENNYDDDGNTSTDHQTTTSNINYTCDNLVKGTYILKVTGIPDIVTEINNDFMISKISFNTNKIVLKDRIFNLEPIIVYTNNTTEREIDAFYSHNGKNQDIIIDGNEKIKFTLSIKDQNVHKKILLSRDQNSINLSKGDLILTNSNFALQKNQWFDPVSTYISNGNLADFALVNNVNSEERYIKSTSVWVSNQ